MSEMAKHFRKVINSFDPIPNSKMTEENLPTKILADWARKACDELEKVQSKLSTAEAENQKLNLILYHKENGLAHPDLNAEILASKLSERVRELEEANAIYSRFVHDMYMSCYSCDEWDGEDCSSPEMNCQRTDAEDVMSKIKALTLTEKESKK